MKIILIVAFIAIGLSSVHFSAAQSIPSLMNCQGQVQLSDGSTPPTSDYELSFRIYDASEGGTMVWGPQRFNGLAGPGFGHRVPVVQGYFNVMLGPEDTERRSLEHAFNGSLRFVELSISNGPPIGPRQRILTTPFAFRSGIAATALIASNSVNLGGYDWTPIFGTNSPNGFIPGSKIEPQSITESKIANGSVTSEKRAPANFVESKLSTFAMGAGGPHSPTLAMDYDGFPELPDLTITYRSEGRPFFVSLAGANHPTGSPTLIAYTEGTNVPRFCPTFQIDIVTEQGSSVASATFQNMAGVAIDYNRCFAITKLPVGNHVLKAQIHIFRPAGDPGRGHDQIAARNIKIIACDL